MKMKFSFNFILLHFKRNEISLVQGRYFIKALLLIFIFFGYLRKKNELHTLITGTHNL